MFVLIVLLATTVSAADNQLQTQITSISSTSSQIFTANDCFEFTQTNTGYCSMFEFEISYQVYNSGGDTVNVSTSDSELVRIVLDATITNESMASPFFIRMEGDYQEATTHLIQPGYMNQTKPVFHYF